MSGHATCHYFFGILTLMAVQPDTLIQCFEDASSAAGPALERCMVVAIAELQVLETQSLKLVERDALASSWRYLSANKKIWCQRYASDLLAEFKKTADHESVAASAAAASTRAAPVALGLVDNADLNQAIDGQRLLQSLLPVVELTLGELNALMSSAQGLENVTPERNPMRPEIFTKVLHRLTTGSLEGSIAAALFLKVLIKPMGVELVQIYAGALKTLKLASVAAAKYQYRLQPSAPAPQSSLTTNGFEGHPPDLASHQLRGDFTHSRNIFAPESANLSDLQVRNTLLKNFLSGADADVGGTLSTSYYDGIEQELSALMAAPDSAPTALDPGEKAQLTRMPVVDRPDRALTSNAALSSQTWGPYGTSRARALVRTQLKKEATKVSQVLGLDVVRELVNQVAQDPRLLMPVRESIVALEPSLSRLALVDPRFFSDDRHSGRQLIERVAQRSFKYNDEFSEEFASFFRDITQSFNQLNAGAVDTAQPFALALSQLEHNWNAHDQQDFDKRQQVLKALRFAEERQASADQIAFDLSSRSDLQQVPGNVLDFLFGPWALVMAHARLVDNRNQIDPGGYGSVVPDLVWSVKHDVTLKQPARLIELIPGLLNKLHSGLALLGQSPHENEDFFESLMKLHRPVLKLRRLRSQRDAEESAAAQLEADEPVVSPAERLESLRALSDVPLWLGRDDLDAAGFEDTQPTEPGQLTTPNKTNSPDAAPEIKKPEETENQPAQAAHKPAPTVVEIDAVQARERAAAVLRTLKTGSWVDLCSKQQWLRAQLVWASTKATLFMFISHGGRPHSMTQRSCEKLIAQRMLRPVNTDGVVAQALDGVADVAAAQSLVVNARSVAGQSAQATA